MSRAEDLFHRLCEGGEQVVDAMIADRQSEELFLDFKRSADEGAGAKLHDSDRQNLSKAISGFGNSEGGVIVWGVECRNSSTRGDVATAKMPIENPQRFVSRLEGAVSGCTTPAHPTVRHCAILDASGSHGFVVTLIPRSYLAPHQCVKPMQYYMRGGSDFIPVPHAVLAGLFGRQPQPIVFHMWSQTLPQVIAVPDFGRVVQIEVGFLLSSHGPGIARDLFLNAHFSGPGGDTRLDVQLARLNGWTGFKGPHGRMSLVSDDGFKLAPQAIIQPLIIKMFLTEPFTTAFRYTISFGHGGSPIRKLETTVTTDQLQHWYREFLNDPDNLVLGRSLVQTVMGMGQHPDYNDEMP